MKDRVTVLSEIGKFQGVGNIEFQDDKARASIIFDDLSDVVDKDLLIGKIIKLIVSGTYYELYTASIVSFDSLNRILVVKDIMNLQENRNEDLKVEIYQDVDIMFVEEYEIIRMKVTTRDLSAGGFCFSTERILDQNKKYEVILSFFDEPLLVSFQIMRVITHNGDKVKMYGCRFVNLNQKTEELIRRKVFLISAEQRKAKRDSKR